jgi:Phage terminase, small subunit
MLGANSHTTRLRAAQTADWVHPWNECSGECSVDVWPVYEALQSHRMYDDWAPADLLELGRLSRMVVAAVELQDRLDREGHTITTERGHKITNPTFTALRTLNSQIVALSRSLGFTLRNRKTVRPLAARAKLAHQSRRRV